MLLPGSSEAGSNKGKKGIMSDKPQEYDGLCHAKTRSGNPCKKRPRKGFVVCDSHGGVLPKVKMAAAARLAQDEAYKEALKRLKADKHRSPDALSEMDRLLAEVLVYKDIFKERVDLLIAEGDLRYKGTTGEQLRAEVSLWERHVDRAWKILESGYKLGIHEKRVELDRQKAVIVAGAIRAILNRLELTDEQQRLAPVIIQEEMLAISAEAESE